MPYDFFGQDTIMLEQAVRKRDRTGAAGRCALLPMEGKSMPAHKHTIVEEYDEIVAFGLSREVDEKSLMYYLQKFSDDDLVRVLVPRMSDEEIDRLFSLISELMRNHLSDNEYHELFLKDEPG